VKSNIGHTQAAAGMSGVIKMVLSLQHQLLPRTLHVDAPSPHVDWSAGAVRLVTEPVPWPANGQPRRAGVSSFGITGTNVHVLLEEAPGLTASAPREDGDVPAASPAATVLDAGVVPWVLSGQSAAALRAQAERLRAYVTGRPDLDPVDVGFSLAANRSAFRFRAVVTGSDREELLAGLAAVAAGEPAAGVVTGGFTPGGDAGRTVFVFPGHGAQWLGMGRELAAVSPVFAARLAECGRALAPYVDWDLADTLAGADGAPSLDRAEVIQPVLWAVLVSLAATWQAAGVAPDAVAGHSQGEIAAACVAGILSLEDAAKVVALRSRALTGLAGVGGMISVVMPAAEVTELLAPWAGRLSVAAVNGPLATVVAGELEALTEFEAELSARRVPRWRVPEQDFVAHSTQVEALEDPLRRALAAVRPGAAQVPFFSTVTCEWMDGTELDAGYWYANLRQTVRFAEAIRALAASGHQTFVEVSPHPVLGGAIQETIEDLGTAAAPVVCGTLLREDSGGRRLLCSLGQVHVHGGAVDWAAVLGGGRRVDLPTYAFQHQRYWPRPSAGRPGHVVSAGLDPAGHPLLGAAVKVAQGDQLLFTGRLSLRTHPWLADHAAGGVVILPGTAFAELALRAADGCGCDRVADLTLEVPLALPKKGAARIQVTVGGPDNSGRREIEIYSRLEDADARAPWTRHASGLLASGGQSPVDPAWADALRTWPPAGATAVPLAGYYETLAERGYGYGPAFRGLRAAWRRDDELFAEVALPADAATDAAAFGIHPALLDAALHVAGLAGRDGGKEPAGALLPFTWSGVSLRAAGASVLRARLSRDQASGRLSLNAADAAGAPVISVESLVLRPISASQLEAAKGEPRESLFAEEWVALPVTVPEAGPDGRWAVIGADPLGLGTGLAMAGADVGVAQDLAALRTSIASGEPVPDVIAAVVAGDGGAAGGDAAVAARTATGQVLRLVQEWLAEGPAARLLLITKGVVATGRGDRVTDPAGAAAWGLVRSAQSENPDSIVLADLAATTAPGDADAVAVLAAALATGEPELAIRDRAAYGRRLARLAADKIVLTNPPGHQPFGRVLITGGTGTLGALTARHMVTGRGARHVMLASRSGPGAPGAAATAAALAACGAAVEVTACDAADRPALAALLDRIPATSPLTDVLHLAGTLDDATITSLTRQRLDAVMRPKADAAWNLHQLTQDLDLRSFVMFSSIAATFGSPGQGNYAAANAFLDALAHQRRAAGLPATSVCWGLWAEVSAMSGHVNEATRADMTSAAMFALTTSDGTTLLDQAMGRDDAVLVAMSMNLAMLRAAAQSEALPVLLHGLVGAPVRRVANAAATDFAGPALREQLARTDETGQEQVVLDLVRAELARLLGYETPGNVEMELSFLELGLDSMLLVRFRNQLNTLTGLRLPGTAMFDSPTPALLAQRIREELSPSGPQSGNAGPRRGGDRGRNHHRRYIALGDAAPLADASAAQRAMLTHSLGGLYEQAVKAGKIGEMMRLIIGLAAFRPTFSTAADLEHIPHPVPVSQGPSTPRLICLPSFVGRSGAREYVRFGREFSGSRTVSVISAPGFAEGEPLAATVDALISVHAENIRRSVADEPFVLVGYSSGGLAAHALTTHLESVGMAPTALVLMDAIPLDKEAVSAGHYWPLISDQVLADIKEQEYGGDDAWLTAFTHYFTLDWTNLKPTAIPTLLIRSADYTSPAHYSLFSDFTISPVPGGHFTLMTENAATTAQAVSVWLAERRSLNAATDRLSRALAGNSGDRASLHHHPRRT
jgi:acyl transferase domain-containing protein/NADP-dependent 3-hydroxy acid dehydrogenase YdfG